VKAKSDLLDEDLFIGLVDYIDEVTHAYSIDDHVSHNNTDNQVPLDDVGCSSIYNQVKVFRFFGRLCYTCEVNIIFMFCSFINCNTFEFATSQIYTCDMRK